MLVGGFTNVPHFLFSMIPARPFYFPSVEIWNTISCQVFWFCSSWYLSWWNALRNFWLSNWTGRLGLRGWEDSVCLRLLLDAVLDLGVIPAKTTRKFHTIQCTNDQKWYEIRIARIEFWKKKLCIMSCSLGELHVARASKSACSGFSRWMLAMASMNFATTSEPRNAKITHFSHFFQP